MRRRMRLTVMSLAAFAAGVGLAVAAGFPGDPDPAFTMTAASISAGSDQIRALSRAADGTFYAAGVSGGDWLLVHYSATGAVLGSTTTDFGGGTDTATGVLLTGGNVLVVGSATVGGALQFATALYDGTALSLAPTYGGGTGKFTFGFGSGNATAAAVAPAPGGDFLVGGTWFGPSNDNKFAFGLVTAGGALDTAGALGATGKKSFDINAGNFTNEVLSQLVAQGSGYFAGGANNAQQGVVVKLDASAAPVAGFATAGIQTVPSINKVYSLVPAATGQIAASGAGFSGNVVGVVSLLNTSDGSPVSAFGPGGTVTTTVPGSTDSYIPVLAYDAAANRFVVAGPANNGFLFDHSDLFTGGMDAATGMMVPNWGPSGATVEKFMIAPGTANDLITAGLIDDQGRFIGGGYSDLGAGMGDEPTIFRVDADKSTSTETGTTPTPTTPDTVPTTDTKQHCSVEPRLDPPCFDLSIALRRTNIWLLFDEDGGLTIQGDYDATVENAGPDGTDISVQFRDNGKNQRWGSSSDCENQSEGGANSTSCRRAAPANSSASLIANAATEFSSAPNGKVAQNYTATVTGLKGVELKPDDNIAHDAFTVTVFGSTIKRATSVLLNGDATFAHLGRAVARPRIVGVKVAVARVTGKKAPALTSFDDPVKARGTCAWLTGKSGRIGKPDATCNHPVWLKAKGTSQWRYKLKHRLGRGHYVALARATSSEGVGELNATPKHGNRKAFTVK